MKLLTVGSSPQSSICLSSQFVSGYHADIILLDNGNILIVDKGSTNGTKVNGKPIAAGVEVLVRRGDSVTFADTPLDWSRVPSLAVDQNAKQLIGIGTHSRNRIRLAGDKVSRFHATIKQTTSGQWFICDHSTNGTTVNGKKLIKDIWVKIKKGDLIRCAGIPVENPVPSGAVAVVATIACAIVLAAGVIAGLFLFDFSGGTMSDKKIYKSFSPSTVLVLCEYHFKVSAGSLDIKKIFDSDEFHFNGQGKPDRYDGENSHIAMATGFFISPDGLIATNLHVARPWVTDIDIIRPVEDYFRSALNELSGVSSYKYLIPYISQLKVDGVIDRICVVPTGMYFEEDNVITCSEIVASKDKNIDLAILRTRKGSGSLPVGSNYINLNRIPDDSAYLQGSHAYISGYPGGVDLQDVEHKLLEAIGTPGSIMSSNSDISFMINADIVSGASGSPVFDNHGHLLGVMSKSNENGYTAAIRSKYIKALLDEKGIKY